MKTQRDRVLAYLALGLISVTIAGLIYFLYYDRNMSALKKRQRQLESEIMTSDLAIQEFENARPNLELAKRLSLPADLNSASEVNAASSNYGDELRNMLLASRFPVDKITLFKPKPQADAPKTGPAAKQKPPFSRVLYDLQFHGDLTMLTEFLDRFYRTPLLHRIKSLQVARPLGRVPDMLPNELDINMTIEALIVDGAEKRKGLLPEKLKDNEKRQRLAHSTSQYEAIDGNNPFYGPPQRQRPGRTPGSEPDFEILPEIVLNGIWTDDTGTWATLFDAADDYEYRIRKTFAGYRVDKYYFIKDTKKKDFDAVGLEKLELRDAGGFLHKSYGILRVDPSDIYLENEGKIYRLHIGWRASDVKALSRDEADKLGLKLKDEKKDDKGKVKVEDKKPGKEAPKSVIEKLDEGR